MADQTHPGRFGEPQKGKIAVLIEDHFDMTEFRKFNDFFPKQGYQVEYISHLWGQLRLRFGSNPDEGVVEEHVEVDTEVNNVQPIEYKGLLLIGAYATDRLRYQPKVRKGQLNQAPAVNFLRNAVKTKGLKIGAICHSLWLFCADRALLEGRRVTCSHNIICDVENAGAEVVYAGDETANVVVDGDLITAKHPALTDEFMDVFLKAIEGKM